MGNKERRVFRDWMAKDKGYALTIQVLLSGCYALTIQVLMSLKYRNKGVVFITMGGPHSTVKCEEEER